MARPRSPTSVVPPMPPTNHASFAATRPTGAPRFRYHRRLTLRELEVLRRLAHGDTTVEAATAMGETQPATRHALRSAAAKLDARTRAHAVAVGLSLGLIDSPARD